MCSQRYSFAIVLWETFTGGRAYDDVPNVLLGHQVVHDGRRPVFPEGTPSEYVELARSCWDPKPEARQVLGQGPASLHFGLEAFQTYF